MRDSSVKRAFVASIACLLLSACDRGGAPSRPQVGKPTARAAACSAASLDVALAEQAGLPAPVVKMRRDIAAAAVACDYRRLEVLALPGEERFSYSFGEDGRPARYWEEQENSGERVLAALVQVLNLPHAAIESQVRAEGSPKVFVWPSASRDDPTEEDWNAVRGLYTDEEIAQMKDFGGYIGYRVGITPEGDWLYFVTGD